MDGREGMTLSGSASYYLNRGGGNGPGSASVSAAGGASGIPPPGYGPLSNPSLSVQPSVGGGTSAGSTFQVENPSQNFSHGTTMPFPASVSPGDPVKKKRGRPRKYAPEGANMSLALSPLSSTPGDGSITPIGPRKNRGRPPGSGWKQRLAPLGEWMNKTVGLAFTPHIIHVGIGEDIAAKILSFAQQKPRALCILSANGSVSAVTMRQPTTSSGTVTYEGRFEILCLSGSYLVAETGGPRNRTGGLSISICSPDGHIIGGAIGGRLVASSPVQVVVCSFIYGGSKANNKTETGSKDDKSLVAKTDDKSLTQVSGSPSQDTPTSAGAPWPSAPQTDQRHPQMDIDLTRG